LLWFGPALLLGLAGWVWWRIGRRAEVQAPSEDEVAAMSALTQRHSTPP